MVDAGIATLDPDDDDVDEVDDDVDATQTEAEDKMKGEWKSRHSVSRINNAVRTDKRDKRRTKIYEVPKDHIQNIVIRTVS